MEEEIKEINPASKEEEELANQEIEQVNGSQAPQHEELKLSDIKELAQILNIPYLESLPEPQPPKNVVKGDFDRIVGSWARQNLTVPFGEENGTVLVATARLNNIDAFELLEACYGRPISLVAVAPEKIYETVNKIRSRLMTDKASSLESKQDEEEREDLKIDVTDAEDEDAPIIRYLNTLIFKANSQRASDIHIEPYEDKFKVRFRIDGVLYDV
ncbi:MAG: hypothetical protein D6780_02175, partial [Candidatus Dadabacteria bacterium]